MVISNFKNTYFFSVLFILSTLISCAKTPKENNKQEELKIVTGADCYDKYLPLIKNKKIAVVANQTSVVNTSKESMHLIDFLIHSNIKIQTVFSPEHGFRGKADAAEHVTDGADVKTGLPIISLYGKNKKPKAEQLEGIDIVVFDIQDVGVRFYTYISTLHYVMEACAEKGIQVIVLDRPNPNGHYVDGPVLEIKHKSFVGMHPVPIVYGLTIGEYATMINGEGWLINNLQCDLKIIQLENYTHNSSYSLTIRPSPNLPNDKSINLYPSLGLFEGTTINAGRGTEYQFQRYGAPDFPKSDFSYTPIPNFGSKYPKHKGELCYGVDLSDNPKMTNFTLKWIIDAYHKSSDKKHFFGSTFTIHAGNTYIEKLIIEGKPSSEIEQHWKKELNEFKKIRAKYLIYP